MRRKAIDTADESKTLLIPEWNETYHSQHGALTEAKHVFIKSGLEALSKTSLSIFEMGFGTGLNALLTLDYCLQKERQIQYHAIEKYPLSYEEVASLDYPERCQLSQLSKQFEVMHNANWEEKISVSDQFSLHKIQGDIQEKNLANDFYDAIFYDAFGPRVQPDLWSEAICKKIFDALKPEGLLVTYCAQGQFKRNLKSVGFEIESLPGPPGKREMTRAFKNRNNS